MTGAAVRAFLVMVLVATPSVILPGIGPDTKQMVALVALFAGALTFAEYNAVYPSLVEFRDAAPFNRVRFLMLFLIVFVLSVIMSAEHTGSAYARLFEALGLLIGHAMDFPYSPVRLATMMMTDGASGIADPGGAHGGRHGLYPVAADAGLLRADLQAEGLAGPQPGVQTSGSTCPPSSRPPAATSSTGWSATPMATWRWACCCRSSFPPWSAWPRSGSSR